MDKWNELYKRVRDLEDNYYEIALGYMNKGEIYRMCII